MNRSSAVFATAVILILLVGTQLTFPRAASAATSTSQSAWWNGSYEFRRSITVVNAGQSPLVNQTVILHLNFTGNDVEDPFAGVRLVDSSGAEVPSAILGPQFEGAFLRSAYLIFLTNFAPQSSAVYYVYYGAPFKNVPAYRGSGPTNSIGSGHVTATLVPLSLDTTQIRLAFGTVDFETTMSGVSYIAPGGAQGYGPTDFSQRPFTNDTGMLLAGQLDPQTSVAYDVLQAGSVQLTRILVVSPKSALSIDAVAAAGPTAASKVTLTSVIGLEGLLSLGLSRSTYMDNSNLLYTQNPDAYFGMRASLGAGSFALGTTSRVLAEASTGQFSDVASYDLASAAGFTWNLGDLLPGSSAWVSSGWGVAFSSAQIAASLPPIPSGATLGQEEVQSVATPKASSIWTAAVAFTNVVIPPSGAVIPFGIKGGDLVPGASSVSGTYAYSVPPSAQLNPNAWKADTSPTGNATAFASPQYFAFDIGGNVKRLSGNVPNTVNTATASLISVPGFAFRGTNAILKVEYKASYNVAGGSLSAQDLFISADLDPTLKNNFSESIVLPVAGSSTNIPVSGCPPHGSPGSHYKQVVPAAFMVGDNTWRTISVGLPASLPAAGFNVMLRLCLATTPGFSGVLDLEVASAGVVLKGPASDIMQSSFGHGSPKLTIRYLPQALSVASVGTTANLTVSLTSQTNSSIGWKDGSTFSGVIAAPLSFNINASVFSKSAAIGPPRFGGVLISSAVSQYAKTGQIGGVSGAVFPGKGIALIGKGNSTSVASGNPFVVGFRSQAVYVSVLDRNRVGVPNVRVVPSADGRNISASAFTNASGIARLQLVPWTFQFNETYQGQKVGSAGIQAGAQPSVTVLSDLYNATLLVRDTRGGALVGAQVSLSIGKYNFSGTTGIQGRYSFEGKANAIYSLTVSVGSGTYFSGEVRATANNLVIQVTTSYLPLSTQLLIAVLVAMVPVAVVAAYFVTRRFRRAT